MHSLRLWFLFGLVLIPVQVWSQAPMCYAAPGGNDLNDGSYWAFAKADVMACYDALPPRGGTIFVRDGGTGRLAVPACKSTDPPGCGIWIMGWRDPNYAHPPAGWRKAKSAVKIVGMAGAFGAQFTYGSQVEVDSGGGDTRHPGIWLSGIQNMTFENIALSNYPCVPMKIGIDSNGGRSEASSVFNFFENDFLEAAFNSVGCGPGVDMGGQSFWNFFRDSQFGGSALESASISSISRSSNVVTVRARSSLPSSWTNGMTVGVVGVHDSSFNGGNFTVTITGIDAFTYRQNGNNATSSGGLASSDQSQAIIMKPSGGSTQGLNFIENALFVHGGVKLYAGGNSQAVYAENVVQEQGTSPIVWFASCVGLAIANLKNLVVSDPVINNFAAVRVDCSGANAIQVQNVGSVDGPATILGAAGPSDSTQSPLIQGQQGISGGYLFGQTDAARRNFGPSATWTPNLASQVSPWNATSGVTFTSVAAPDGTMKAAQATTPKTGQNAVNFIAETKNIFVGDILICGVWVRSVAAAGGFQNGGSNPLFCNLSFVAYTNAWRIGNGAAQKSNGEWDWVWTAFKVGSISSSNAQLNFDVVLDNNHPVQVYAPVLVYIPAGTVSDNEAAQYAINLQTYRDDAVPGQVSLLRGEQFKADSIQIGACATVSSGKGAPTAKPCTGSIYLRQDGAAGSTFYIYENGVWKAQF
jgi:hypothetical protein